MPKVHAVAVRALWCDDIREPYRLSLELILPNAPDEVWAAVECPALFLHVAGPLVEFRRADAERFPDRWVEGEYRGSMRLFGLMLIGWQTIVISFPPAKGETRVLHDNGYGPMLRKWSHRIEVSPEGEGTRYVDRLEFDAGIATPITAFFVKQFFKHRQRRLKALARNSFTQLKL